MKGYIQIMHADMSKSSCLHFFTADGPINKIDSLELKTLYHIVKLMCIV